MAQSYRESSGGGIYLSKSLFIRGLQCHKSLYLQKYRPELKDEVSEETQMRFDMGFDVGSLAQQLFPGGVIVPYEELSHSEQIDMTHSLIERGVDTIYEATFFYNSVFVKADILHHGVSGWEIYEVKASASMKDYHVDDVSVQYYVVSGSGLPVARAYLVHINTQYVRQGDIEVDKLFTMVDLTETAKAKEPFIKEELQKQRYMLQEGEPALDIGPHCDDPFECDFKSHCWSHIPSPSVFDYREKGRPDAFDLYRKGIVKMEEVSPDILGWRQKLQLDGLLYQKNHTDVGAVKAFIESLWYPLCFMDFETTFMIPIPMYDGTRPYQQVPFQFSLHIMDKPGGALSHYEFLADGKDNPQKEFLEKLLAAISRNACILVWNQNFEIQRLKELANALPEKSADTYVVIENIRDMMIPFRDKSIYHWKFNGSYSIKVVLPALVPELSYENLEISDGEMASSAWVRMIQSDDEKEKEMLRQQLLCYCHMDTLAMVRILEIMREITDIRSIGLRR
jgi:hypothetical protein